MILDVLDTLLYDEGTSTTASQVKDEGTEISFSIIHTITNRVLFSLEGNAFLDRFVRHELHSFKTTDGNPRPRQQEGLQYMPQALAANSSNMVIEGKSVINFSSYNTEYIGQMLNIASGNLRNLENRYPGLF